MQRVRAYLILLLLIGIGAGVYYGTAAMRRSNSAKAESELQKAELEQCKQRLAMFYKAWSQYKADHKGAEPPNIESMIPKYIADGTLLICPTAERWQKNKMPLSQGQVTINRRTYPVSYGFRWMASGNAHDLRKYKDAAPLVTCEAHEEGMYIAAYRKPPPAGAFSEESRGKWIEPVQNMHMLAVLHNGTTEQLSADKE